MLKKNIIANILGSGWVAALTIIVTPLQVHLLGVEAYGIVGLIAILQIVLGTLDLGLSATITQSVAADRTSAWQGSASLMNSGLALYHLVAIAIGLLMWGVAPWIARTSLHARTLDPETIVWAVRIIGLYVAVRWPIALYTGVISGVQRMDMLAALKACAGTVRLVGGVIAIALVPTITVFLWWFLFSAAVELVMYGVVAHRLVPVLTFRSRPSLAPFRSVWKFSLTISAISILAMLLTQIDRLLISTMLDLHALGLYSLAYTAGLALTLIQVSLNSASLPSFAASDRSGPNDMLVQRYQRVSELMGYSLAFPCLALAVFGNEILAMWVGHEASNGAYLPLRFLALGFFVAAMVSNAYTVSVATRNVAIPALVNLVGAPLYVPLLYGLIRHYGITGAACGWLVLNCFYMLTLLPIVHRRLLVIPVGGWLMRNVARPATAATASLALARWVTSDGAGPLAILAALVGAGLVYCALAFYVRVRPY